MNIWNIVFHVDSIY